MWRGIGENGEKAAARVAIDNFAGKSEQAVASIDSGGRQHTTLPRRGNVLLAVSTKKSVYIEDKATFLRTYIRKAEFSPRASSILARIY